MPPCGKTHTRTRARPAHTRTVGALVGDVIRRPVRVCIKSSPNRASVGSRPWLQDVRLSSPQRVKSFYIYIFIQSPRHASSAAAACSISLVKIEEARGPICNFSFRKVTGVYLCEICEKVNRHAFCGFFGWTLALVVAHSVSMREILFLESFYF